MWFVLILVIINMLRIHDFTSIFFQTKINTLEKLMERINVMFIEMKGSQKEMRYVIKSIFDGCRTCICKNK